MPGAGAALWLPPFTGPDIERCANCVMVQFGEIANVVMSNLSPRTMAMQDVYLLPVELAYFITGEAPVVQTVRRVCFCDRRVRRIDLIE